MKPIGPDVFKEYRGFPLIKWASICGRMIISEMSIIPEWEGGNEKAFRGYMGPASCDRRCVEPALVFPKTFLYDSRKHLLCLAQIPGG
jgi:hypothetical protein